jgi:hypothetical protein
MWKALLLLLVPGAVTAQDTDLWLFRSERRLPARGAGHGRGRLR